MANASARTSVDEAAGSIASTLGRSRRESSCRRGCWVAAEPGSTCAGGPSSTPAGTYQTLRSGSRRAPKCLAMSFSAKGTCRSIRDAPTILFQAGALAGKSAETRGARSPEYFGRLRRDRQVCCGGGLRGEGSGGPGPYRERLSGSGRATTLLGAGVTVQTSGSARSRNCGETFQRWPSSVRTLTVFLL